MNSGSRKYSDVEEGKKCIYVVKAIRRREGIKVTQESLKKKKKKHVVSTVTFCVSKCSIQRMLQIL